jgi:type III restriction enzyme
MQNLYEEIDIEKEAIRKYAPDVIAVPKYISDNLKYEFFDWQREAFENLLVYEKDHKKNPTHLMFNMATGTGKTMLMAACILYYYRQGYRKFIFFVNQNNIIDKTENNFIDNTHNKYLFKDRIVIDDKTVKINKVNTFSNNNENIEIKFTTIQKLYNDIHIERENQVYLDDLIKKDIVMLADEAHHLNADTKNKKGQEELDLNVELKESASEVEVEKKGWEHTVIELLLNKNGKNKTNNNILLEFTATIPTNEKIAEKYKDKIISKFGLKEFLSAGYTKEINLISSTLEKKERILQALLFNWYRHKIALRNNIANFKPVILFRSKTIQESKDDFKEFNSIIKSLKVSDFKFLDTIADKVTEGATIYEQGKSRTLDVIEFIKKEKISKSEIIDFLKYAFDERNCIITNSKDGTKTKEKTTEEQEKLLNNLEDKNNHIRAIFTVDRLTEGWDVLNLFDIVRLYTTQQSGGANSNATPEGTIKEKQLIGRGVRYCPFPYQDTQKNKRRFDNDLKNEMRVLEELYYYTYDEDSRYISHLKNELRKDGYINDGKVVKVFSLKEKFMKSDFYRDVKLFHNERIDNPSRKKKALTDIRKEFVQYYKLKGLELNEQELDFDKPEDVQRLNLREKGLKTIPIKVGSFERHIFQKALNIKAKASDSLLRFELLKNELQIDSIDELQNKFLNDFEIQLVTQNVGFEDISNEEKLDMLLRFFDKLLFELKQDLNPHKGTAFKAGQFSDFFREAKEKSVVISEKNERFYNEELKYKDWYVLSDFYGTSEEQKLIEFVQGTILNLKESYSEVYLLRNEELYKIYDFEKGRGFQPDFLLFLRQSKKMYYQIFIEPKGDNLLEIDKWKNDFLKEITEKYSDKNVLRAENKDYILIGLPFFNENENQEFAAAYNKLIN